MSEIAVRHTREECFAHTNDWKKPYDGNILRYVQKWFF